MDVGVEKKFEYSVVMPGTRAYRDYLALRYAVFCEELKRVPAINRFFSDVSLESDAYDVYSVHVLCRSLETGAAVGCSRLILPNAKGLSITSRYTMHHQAAISSNRIGEIGRLAIAKELRRNRGELSSAGLYQPPAQRSHTASVADKQDGPLVAMGLYNEIFKLANKYGLAYCYAAMEPSLARLLTRIGFPFQAVGPLNNEVQPPRQPYSIDVHVTQTVFANRNICFSPSMSAVSHQVKSLCTV